MAEWLKKNEKKTRHNSHGTPKSGQKQLAPPSLTLLVTIVNREKADVYLELLRFFDINLQLATAARGTASSEMLRYLGLTDSSKTVIFSVVREDTADEALKFLSEQFGKIKNGKGIAFTVPMSSVIGVSAYRFLGNSTGGETLPQRDEAGI